MVSIPTLEPFAFVAGDTVQWRRVESNYLPADGWVLSYLFSSRGGTFSASSTDNGDGSHLVTLTAAATADYVPERYQWQAYVTLGVERHTVGWGETEVLAGLDGRPPADTRSTARRLLDAVEAALESRASTDQLSYSVGGVSLSRMSLADMIAARSRLQAEVLREKQAERIARGLGHSGNIRVRL